MKKLLLVLLSLAPLVSTSRAQLLGDTITVTSFNLTPSSATIGSGIEFTTTNNSLSLDFGASTLTLTPAPTLFGFAAPTWVFSGFDSIITGVSVATNGGWIGPILTPQFTASSITFDPTADIVSSGALLVFNIQTRPAGVSDGGTTALLLGGALAALAAVRRRLA